MILSFKILWYNCFLNSFVPFVTTSENALRFGLTEVQVSLLNTFLARWQEDIKDYIDPLKNDARTIETINLDYINGYKLTQTIRLQIKNNITIQLTSKERAICDIKLPDTNKTPIGIPKDAPILVCVEVMPFMMRFVALYPASPFKRAKPNRVSAIGIKTAITKAGDPPPAPEDYFRQEDETTTNFEMLFTSDDKGKTLYIKGCYLNARGEAGKDGMPFVITIA